MRIVSDEIFDPIFRSTKTNNGEALKSQKKPGIKKMPDYSEKIIKELEYNYKGYRRYKTILFIVDKPTAHKEIKELVINLGKNLLDKNIPCEIVDFFKDVVEESKISLGNTGNTFNELIDWIIKKISSAQKCLLMYEIDALLSTWNTPDIKAFFKKILFHDGIDKPVLLISCMAGRFVLPMNTTGQGLVIKQSTVEEL